MVVECKIVAEEGKTCRDCGREALIDRIQEWKAESDGATIRQMHHLGGSIDWEHKRFAVGEDLPNAVKKVFVHLYKKGLIYRGERLVDQDPKLCTTISDLEVENRESRDSMWHIRCPLTDDAKTVDDRDYLVVATTRPETLLGDTGVTINPEDPRYKDLTDKYVILPLVNRRTSIVDDEYADMEKDTGRMRVTPVHGPNDYEADKRHALPMINILTFGGDIREGAQVFDTKSNEPGVYSSKILAGFQELERLAVRKVVIAAVDALNLLEEIKPHDSTAPHGDRDDTVIEPVLTDQWYVRADILAKPAVGAVRNDDIQFVPKQYENAYFSWMCDIRGQYISRQLWWGRRVPTWHGEASDVYAGHNEDEVCKENNLGADVVLHQDEDVLNTWLSPVPWTFSTLGWPENTNTLHQPHPTSVMVLDFDTIFFRVAHMIMMTMHSVKDENDKPQVPFYTVYITGLICGDEGQKVSGSKGNVIDPLDMVDGISLPELLEKHTGNMMQPQLADKIHKRTEKQFPSGIGPRGTDALCFTLTALVSTGRDINWDTKRLRGHRSFCSKLWNANCFVLMNTEGQGCGLNSGEMTLSLVDRWILAEFSQTIKAYRGALGSFRFDTAADILYEFTRNQFCDWYLELTKPVVNGGTEAELRSTRHMLVTVLESLLCLAYPIILFITETIWQRVKVLCGIIVNTIMLQPLPQYDASRVDEAALADTEWLKQATAAVRSIRIGMNIVSGRPLELLLRGCSADVERRVNENCGFLQTLARPESITVLPADDKGPVSVTKIINDTELLIPTADLINKEDELARLVKEIAETEGGISRIENKLANEGSVVRTPEMVIAKEREKLESYAGAKAKLIEQQVVIAAL